MVVESKDVTISNNLIEANDKSGVMLEFLFNGSSNIKITNNRIHYNTGKGIESVATKTGIFTGNKLAGNGL